MTLTSTYTTGSSRGGVRPLPRLVESLLGGADSFYRRSSALGLELPRRRGNAGATAGERCRSKRGAARRRSIRRLARASTPHIWPPGGEA